LSTDSHFDVVWLGTGQATMTSVPQLIAAGKRVAVVEGAQFGGTCVNSGCTPTKTLVASAYAMHAARRGDDFGFSIDRLTVDFPGVMAPQQANRQSTSASIESRLMELTEGAVYKGYAEFVSNRDVLINDQRISGDTFVIHVGTHANVPDVAGIDSIEWLTNETILDLDVLPEHLVIVGGSYIALEFGQLFRRLGSQVTVLERGPRLVAREDEDISDLVAARLVDECIDLRFDFDLSHVSPADGVTVGFAQAGTPQQVVGSHILFAVGRTPNSESLNLSAADVATNERGYITVNDVLQTSAPHIYALGDVNGRGAFTHTSVNDGEIFWDHYSRSIGQNTEVPELDRTLATRTMIYSMFIDPPLARVGMNETEARKSGRNVLMATMPMSHIARAREKRETHGLVKVIVDADNEQILGATIFGTSGDEVIGSFATLIQTGASYKVFRRIVFPHPTITELMPWVLDRLEPLTP
jgi:pyruvate/2-oxoglutarate dehydrogenase complex dihydrolipoamide dehydrogenase (E3) component